MMRAFLTGLSGLILGLSLLGCSSEENSKPPSRSTTTVQQFAQPTEIERIVLSGSVGVPGDTLYLPFDMPSGVQRLELRFLEGSPETKLGLGVFGPEGADFGMSDFRGISGEERREIFIQADSATFGFSAGELNAGQWTVVVPNFLNFGGDALVEVALFSQNGEVSQNDRALTAPGMEPVPEMIVDQSGWYKGDLHVHTVYSSDAFNSGSAKTPKEIALIAKESGLDFIALTDHNVTVQNRRLRSASPEGFLLLGGEEVTTWIGGPGHLIAIGLDEDDHVDWRFRPEFGRYARTITWNENDSAITPLLKTLRQNNIFTSAAHPYVLPGAGSDWGFFRDSDVDIQALPDSLEVWNAEFFASSGDLTIKHFDQELARNRKLCINGGSDIHGLDGVNPLGIPYKIGHPTTVVWADSLSRKAVVESLIKCKAYITEAPSGPALTITSGESMMGDTLVGNASEIATLNIQVAKAETGDVLSVFHNGIVVGLFTLQAEQEDFEVQIPFALQGGVRAELRKPLSRTEYPTPRAMTNPIFIRVE